MKRRKVTMVECSAMKGHEASVVAPVDVSVSFCP